MRSRGLLAAWLLVALVFLVLLGYALARWQALSAEAARASAERRRLADEIRLREAQLAAEMRANAALLRDMQWTTGGGDPTAFLTRLAQQAAETRMKVTAVGPLERQATPQFSKSWHAVQVVAPYRELRELAARVERDKGILEDMRIEPAPGGAPGRPEAAAPPDEVQARFRMTALELSPQAKKVVDRVVAAAGEAPAPPGPGSVALPAAGGARAPVTRDPFAFLAAKPASRPGPPLAPLVERPQVPLELSAIVAFPGGNLAIVNNQIVKVGDTVGGYRVESITDTSISLREPGAAPRTLLLPELGAAPPAPPRR